VRPAARVERIAGATKHPWLETEPTLKGELMKHLNQVLIQCTCTATSVDIILSYQCKE